MTDNRMQGDKLLCEVFKSSRKDEMYLYDDKRDGLAEVAQLLLERFGKPISVMTLILTPQRSLGRAQAGDVMTAIREQGLYLQLPPAKEAHMLGLYRTAT